MSDIGIRAAGTIGAAEASVRIGVRDRAIIAGRGRGIGTAFRGLAAAVTGFLGLTAGFLGADAVLAGFFGLVAALAPKASIDNAAIAANVAFAVGQNVI